MTMKKKKKKIDLLDVKQALSDPRFRDSLGFEFQDDIVKYLTNPGCRCNYPIYRRILKEAKTELLAYFPSKDDVVDEQEEISKLAQNYFTVINCTTIELEDKLRGLPPGRKQIVVSRYEDQVTVIVNELDVIY